MTDYRVDDHGAVGDGTTLDTAAIQAAIDACTAGGGGRVLLSSGRSYLAGSFALKGNVELHVERGARLLASDRLEDYPTKVFEGGDERDKRAWITAKGADNIALTGGGVIDGRCQRFITERGDHICRTQPWRPAMTCLVGCRTVRVHDLTFTNAANWTLHFTGCDDVVVHGVTIDNPLDFPNCDGIDPDHCRNVRISDCHISCADDCIVLKTTRDYVSYGPTENVTVTGCTLVSTSCAIKIGSESVSDIRDCVFQACVIRNSNRGLGIQLRDEGSVENILFSDMVIETHLFEGGWWGVGEPIAVSVLPRNDQVRPGHLRNIRFRNLLCRSENGVYLQGYPLSRPDAIEFDGVQVHIARSSSWPGGMQDPRPCAMDLFAGQPTAGKATPWGQRLVHGNPGFYLAQSERVTLRHCSVEWGDDLRDCYTHALEAHDVARLERSDFRGQAAHAGLAAESIDDRGNAGVSGMSQR